MSILHVKYLLVGGGLASSAAAGAVRELDVEGSVLLVGQEVNRPYHRPPLSKTFLRREADRASLSTQPQGWYAEQRVELRTGRRVAQLDTGRQTAALDSGEEVTYDRLLLATGSSPARLEVPGAALPNVFYLRTIEDAERLHNAVEKATHEGRPNALGKRGRAAVVGGGLLGVELAGSLTQLGVAVDLICASHPWDRFAGDGTGRMIAQFLQRNGVTVHTGVRPSRLDGDGRVQRIVLSDAQTLDCDFAVIAIGAVANKDLVRNTPIAVGRAILVDAHCRTNVPHVYAAGDCAALLDPLFGKHRVMDHWDNAVITGALAGRNMAGIDEPYAETNRFATKVFDVETVVWGEPRLVNHRLLRGAGTANGNVSSIPPAFAEIGIAADGRVAQVVAMGDVPQRDALRELVSRRVKIDGNEELLKDPATDLTMLFAR